MSLRKRICYSFDIHFTSTEEKDAFVTKLQRCRKVLTVTEVRELDNYSLFTMLLDHAVDEEPDHVIGPGPVERATVKSMLHNNGKLSRI